jgi:hypothetical protein
MTLGKSHENDIVLRTILNLFEKVYKIWEIVQLKEILLKQI